MLSIIAMMTALKIFRIFCFIQFIDHQMQLFTIINVIFNACYQYCILSALTRFYSLLHYDECPTVYRAIIRTLYDADLREILLILRGHRFLINNSSSTIINAAMILISNKWSVICLCGWQCISSFLVYNIHYVSHWLWTTLLLISVISTLVVIGYQSTIRYKCLLHTISEKEDSNMMSIHAAYWYIFFI